MIFHVQFSYKLFPRPMFLCRIFLVPTKQPRLGGQISLKKSKVPQIGKEMVKRNGISQRNHVFFEYLKDFLKSKYCFEDIALKGCTWRSSLARSEASKFLMQLFWHFNVIQGKINKTKQFSAKKFNCSKLSRFNHMNFRGE